MKVKRLAASGAPLLQSAKTLSSKPPNQLSTSSPEGRDLEANGEGVHAVTFKTLNLARAAEFLKSKKQRTEAQKRQFIRTQH